jgi:hypothetical protein
VLLEQLARPVWDVEITLERWTATVLALNSAS